MTEIIQLPFKRIVEAVPDVITVVQKYGEAIKIADNVYEASRDIRKLYIDIAKQIIRLKPKESLNVCIKVNREVYIPSSIFDARINYENECIKIPVRKEYVETICFTNYGDCKLYANKEKEVVELLNEERTFTFFILNLDVLKSLSSESIDYFRNILQTAENVKNMLSTVLLAIKS